MAGSRVGKYLPSNFHKFWVSNCCVHTNVNGYTVWVALYKPRATQGLINGQPFGRHRQGEPGKDVVGKIEQDKVPET